MGPSSATACVDTHIIEKELTPEEYELRREFVRLYLETRNAYAACLALGFVHAYAEDWARMFMSEGVVRRLIIEAEQAEESESGKLERQKRYRAWMEQQATYYGPGASHGARVTAIANLMKMEGMEAPSKSETEVTYKGGVMLVPHMTNPDEWGEVAAKSQANLKDTVKD